ncbi:MAG: phytoene desaturase [Bacteroidetes bacterium]|nr:phytoene desaturase [Bacteroidota bacterium]
MNPQKISIVGAGIGGIATAIRLAAKGHEVVVFEKNEVPGGKMYWIERSGYAFDAGPSLFTQPQNIEALFAAAGETMRDHFDYVSVDISCRYFFENGKRINAYTSHDRLAEELHQTVGEPKENVIRYLNASRRVYDAVGTIFLNHSLHRVSTWLHPRVLKALSAVRFSHLFGTLNGYNRAHFKTPEAVQIFNRFATYNGSNPYRAPGMLSLIPHLELTQGTYYPKGGMISIPRSLVALAKRKGVRFELNSSVERIVLDGETVKGIISNDAFHPADAVVSNVDAYYTYQRLLGKNQLAENVLRNERSSSAFIFYWGMNRSYPALHLHNIFFSHSYQQEFACLFDTKEYHEDPTIYINITSKMEEGQAPSGCENWFVMVNAPARVDFNWQEHARWLRARVIQKLERLLGEPVGAHIAVEEVLHPELIQQRTDSYLGSLYGTSSNSKFSAFLRHSNQASGVRGLYCVGGSVHPGGGIPLCLKGAEIVSGMFD